MTPEQRARISAALKGHRHRRPADLRVVPATELGWSPRTDWWLLDNRREEAHGPFSTYDAAVAASQRPSGSFGYGNVAPDLSFLFPPKARATHESDSR